MVLNSDTMLDVHVCTCRFSLVSRASRISRDELKGIIFLLSSPRKIRLAHETRCSFTRFNSLRFLWFLSIRTYSSLLTGHSSLSCSVSLSWISSSDEVSPSTPHSCLHSDISLGIGSKGGGRKEGGRKEGGRKERREGGRRGEGGGREGRVGHRGREEGREEGRRQEGGREENHGRKRGNAAAGKIKLGSGVLEVKRSVS